MTALITKEEIADLLGAPLSAAQLAGVDGYLELATAQLASILGYQLEDPITEERTFYGRAGSRSLIVGPFTEIDSVSLNGSPIEYRVGRSNKPFTYEVVTRVEQCEGDEITVMATWGFTETPSSLKLLLANAFAAVSAGGVAGAAAKVKSETVLSHSTTFDNDSVGVDAFMKGNASLLALYRIPTAPRVDAGRVLWRTDDDLSGYRPYF